ncbi:murein hydrolase activator EnvC [Novosphingobium sp.]|uniref:murein hydrolase activator EnvC family protein n=1 Tax=Novosphingobium sp. TaxID=1874826 RepID=UPI002736FE91|nr:peptidoglycan DD-metalloendopeptidase family protein [Novosphingobium sp.]MDP3906219.1 peptidoglycan DD-metalloendopeptidase family protein [Novosphingobium sp.]
MIVPRPLRLLPLLTALMVGAATAQVQLPVDTAEDSRKLLAEAQTQGAQAGRRAEALEAQAAGIVAAADRTAQEAAAVAARIQQTEAKIAEHEARIRLIDRQRVQLRARLAERQRPVVQLTAALQRLSRRPAAFSLVRPGSLREAVYLRAVLETMLPEVQRRTAGLRAEIERGRALQRQAQTAAAALRAGEGELAQRRQSLAALESQQRLASRQASGSADREAERALALAEQARDLSVLAHELDKAGALRGELAALPGPVLRPAQPQSAEVRGAAGALTEAQIAPPSAYILPLAGRLVTGFGESKPGQPRSRGISIAARGGAQVVTPAAGRVAFSGPFQGYGNIVIIEHPGGWTSLVTGLAALDARVGQQLVSGSPLGVTGPGRPVLTLELRRQGEPVNPLDFVRG